MYFYYNYFSSQFSQDLPCYYEPQTIVKIQPQWGFENPEKYNKKVLKVLQK